MATIPDARQPESSKQQVVDAMINPLAPLPNELILEVCEHILPRDEGDRICHEGEALEAKATFAALALTCRYLHPFGMRYLYHTYHAWLPTRGHGFLSAVRKRLDLASHVHEILVLRDHDAATISASTDPGTYVQELAMEVHKVSLPFKESLLELLETDPHAVDVALLIHNSRFTLQELQLPEFDRSTGRDNSIWAAVLIHSTQRLCHTLRDLDGFSKLRTLSIALNSLAPSVVSSVMLLPSLHNLTLMPNSQTSSSASQADMSWHVAPKSSKVQILNIMYTRLPSRLISRMLESCALLKDFKYCGYPMENSLEWHSEVLAAVKIYQEHSLDDLFLDAGWGGDAWLGYSVLTNTIGNMEALKTMRIHHSVLLGCVQDTDPDEPDFARGIRDLLPPNLDSLSIIYLSTGMDPEVDYNVQLEALLPAKSPDARPIRKIEVRYTHYDPRESFDLRLWSLEQTFTEAGVEFDNEIRCVVNGEGELLLHDSRVFVNDNR
jgi:hypothetical protein